MIALKFEANISEDRKKKISICPTESDDMSEADDDGMEDAIIDTGQKQSSSKTFYF